MLSPLFANVNKKKNNKKEKTVRQGSDAMLVYCSPEICSTTWVGLHGAVALKKGNTGGIRLKNKNSHRRIQ